MKDSTSAQRVKTKGRMHRGNTSDITNAQRDKVKIGQMYRGNMTDGTNTQRIWVKDRTNSYGQNETVVLKKTKINNLSHTQVHELSD